MKRFILAALLVAGLATQASAYVSIGLPGLSVSVGGPPAVYVAPPPPPVYVAPAPPVVAYVPPPPVVVAPPAYGYYGHWRHPHYWRHW